MGEMSEEHQHDAPAAESAPPPRQEHWLDNPAAQAAFWPAVRALGYQSQREVYAALDVADGRSISLSKSEALAALVRHKQIERWEMAGELPEAPALAFSAFLSPRGVRWSVTLRAGLPPAEAAAIDADLRERMIAWEDWLAEQDWLAAVDGRDSAQYIASAAERAARLAEDNEQMRAPVARQETGDGEKAAPGLVRGPAAGPAPAAAKVEEGSEEVSFEATEIEFRREGGRESAKVYGPPFPKYGVVCWPEVYATLFDRGVLDPETTTFGRQYPLKGVTALARTQRREDGSRRTKVVRLDVE